ncbi:GNAT family N-acetyltransferase [Bacillus solimangrovi]|uniref:N-acetyltransferase domain-containing protein n=1 Tax=Bacillus solimangrovi TaxID=1305675 RepID=A0A1E5LEM4_9BACI|nr:GNAT family protein [Bacillus solimangrovi]OEH92541.1 hypothetical protein BFG57_15515 [Bacillus solimangrovi]
MQKLESNVKFLQSDRLFLRPLEEDDLDLFYEKALWEQEGRRLTGSQTVFTRSSVQSWFENVSLDSTRIDLLICLQATNAPIGEMAMLDIDHRNQKAVVRISIFDNDYLGKGFGTEAMSLLVAYGFDILNLHRVGLDVFSYNERAINSYKKLGFKQEGVIRDSLFYNGQFHDSIMMGVLRHEFVKCT